VDVAGGAVIGVGAEQAAAGADFDEPEFQGAGDRRRCGDL
jgi:hypothetical protein